MLLNWEPTLLRCTYALGTQPERRGGRPNEAASPTE